MRPPERKRLATVAAVVDDHGGPIPFWMAWIHSELDPELQAWVRQQAAGAPALRLDLQSIEQPGGAGFSTAVARETVRDALEANDYFAAADQPGELAGGFTEDGEEALTDLALGEPPGAAARPPRLDGKVKPALFDLLAAVEIRIPDGQLQQEARRLLEELVGWEAVRRFRRLHGEVRTWRAQPRQGPGALNRVLQGLVPDLFREQGGRPRSQLSYRLYLRGRLQRYCRRRGWNPTGPRFHDLTSAFATLDRRRIGELIRRLEREEAAAEDAWSEGLQLATADLALE